MDAWSLMRGDAFIHFVCDSQRVNIRLGVLLLIPKSPQTSVFEKLATELKLKPKQKLLRCKCTEYTVTLNVRALNTINQLPKLTASTTEHNKDVVCIQEHKYYHSEVKIKYHDSGNGWTFISTSAQKNSVQAVIGRMGILLSHCALISLNSIEKTQLIMMVATFSSNPIQ